jgi:hypothetical protein
MGQKERKDIRIGKEEKWLSPLHFRDIVTTTNKNILKFQCR